MATEVALAVEVVSQDRQVVRWAAAVAMAELKAVELKAEEPGVVAMMAMEAAVVVALAEANSAFGAAAMLAGDGYRDASCFGVSERDGANWQRVVPYAVMHPAAKSSQRQSRAAASRAPSWCCTRLSNAVADAPHSRHIWSVRSHICQRVPGG